MEPDFPISEETILNRYELGFALEENQENIRLAGKLGSCFLLGGVALYETTQQVTESDRLWATALDIGTLYTSGWFFVAGATALAGAAHEYVSYRRNRKAIKLLDT